MRTLCNTLAVLALAAVSAAGQCTQYNWRINGLVTFCKVVDLQAAFNGTLAATSGNGAITIHGWDGTDVAVRATIQTAAPTDYEAEAVAASIVIDTTTGQVRATGPKTNAILNWSVSFDIFVPRDVDLNLTIGNGALLVMDIHGRVQLAVGNGAVTLMGMSGEVDGKVSNGAIFLALSGDHWDGAGVDLKTTNGASSIVVPHDYSAHFEASATIGVISTNYPVQVAKGKWGLPGIGGSLTFDAGNGGAPIRVSTVVGTIKIAHEQ